MEIRMEIWNEGNGVNRAIGGNPENGLEVVWKRVENVSEMGSKQVGNEVPTRGQRYANGSLTVH